MPELTPGWGISGVILMASGAAYALVGIKSRWLHCFLSVGFLSVVGITVLIIYVMTPPISNAVQGAYVVAAVGTGALLGGASLVFPDILECLGCLLGGFCLAMWLLTLKTGGLLGSGGGGTAIFICIFSAAGFAGYFSRWTRTYFMIACISMNGATAAVIGIDCFSRAGLKEFWAWIWNLNDNLFPYNAETYPLTKGIRVEQAITIILMLGGIVSQMRLWNVIKERRARREEGRRKDQEAIQSEDLKAGGEIEKINARERRDWEAAYGNPKSPTSVHTAHDSGMGDMESEKKYRNSGTATTTTRPSMATDGEDIEMAELPMEMPIIEVRESGDEDQDEPPPKSKTAAEMIMGRDQNDGMIMVRVAADDIDAMAVGESEVGNNATSALKSPSPQPISSTPSTPVPQVVPLPFRVPHIETDKADDGDRSSIATFADGEDERRRRRSVDSKRSSFAKRLSVGSADLLRRISHQSLAKQLEATKGAAESQEDLTFPVHGDRDSIAATFDDESSIGDDEDMRSPVGERPFSMEIKAELADKPGDGDSDDLVKVKEAVAKKLTDENRLSRTTVSTGILDSAAIDTNETEVENAASPENLSEKNNKQRVEDDKESKVGKSIVSEADSKPASLTKDRLPRALSKIALSYRTNEWAKHLSNAELPAPEELNIPEAIEVTIADVNEPAAPVNVDDLKKTAENATPPPAMPRSVSAMSARRSHLASTQRPANLTVPGSDVSANSPPHSPTPSNFDGASAQNYLSPNVPSSRRTSARTVSGMAEQDSYEPRMSSESRHAALQAAAAALAGEMPPRTSSDNGTATPTAGLLHSRPPVPGVVSYSSPQTLIGKRDMLLRAKSQALQPDSLRGSHIPSGLTSDNGSVQNMAEYGTVAALGPSQGYADNVPNSRWESAIINSPADLDDLPLSQRKALIKSDSRRNSMSSTNSNNASGGANSRRSSFGYAARQPQPRPSIQAGPLINSVYSIPGTSTLNSLLPHQTQTRDVEVRRDIDMQRQFLMSKKEAQMRQNESARIEKESRGRQFEMRMRTDSELMEAHREAMRKMQRTASRQA